MNAIEIRETALVGIQTWDEKAAKRKGYNPFGFELACNKLDEFVELCETHSVKFAILKCFINRLAVEVAKAFDIELTANEVKYGVRGINFQE